MKKAWKTFWFLMEHVRIRLVLAKKIHRQQAIDKYIRYHFIEWNTKPDPKNEALRRAVNSILSAGLDPHDLYSHAVSEFGINAGGIPINFDA